MLHVFHSTPQHAHQNGACHVPAKHRLQPPAADTFENLPGGQGYVMLMPVPGAKYPGNDAMHDVCMLSGWYVPIAQLVHRPTPAPNDTVPL